jgi:hypothetical protein
VHDIVNFKVHKWVIALTVLCSYKRSVNPITNANHVFSHWHLTLYFEILELSFFPSPFYDILLKVMSELKSSAVLQFWLKMNSFLDISFYDPFDRTRWASNYFVTRIYCLLKNKLCKSKVHFILLWDVWCWVFTVIRSLSCSDQWFIIGIYVISMCQS